LEQVRRATAADLQWLEAVERSAATLFRGTIMERFVNGPFTPADALEKGRACGLLWVAPVGEEVAGFLLADEAGDWLHILELSVARRFQGQGLGRALLTAARTHAQQTGARMLSLTTDRLLPWNAPAYARFGFRELHEDDQPEWLQRILLREAMTGLDAGRRVAMGLTP
jgi:GNAT superfamily N-acetyltransferase